MKQTSVLILSMLALISASLACNISSGQQDVLNTSPAPTAEAQVPEEQQEPKPERLLPGVNVPEIELLTPTDGVGIKPKFEWTEVDGAASYSLMLFDENGEAYWAWMGKSTFVYLGGLLTAPPEDSVGPILQPGMRWAVAAFDAQEHLLATSVFRPISP